VLFEWNRGAVLARAVLERLARIVGQRGELLRSSLQRRDRGLVAWSRERLVGGRRKGIRALEDRPHRCGLADVAELDQDLQDTIHVVLGLTVGKEEPPLEEDTREGLGEAWIVVALELAVLVAVASLQGAVDDREARVAGARGSKPRVHRDERAMRLALARLLDLSRAPPTQAIDEVGEIGVALLLPGCDRVVDGVLDARRVGVEGVADLAQEGGEIGHRRAPGG
jgi:hypothetical protein